MPVLLNNLEKKEKKQEKKQTNDDESEMRKQIESTTIQELFD